MLKFLRTKLEAGPVEGSMVVVGANMQLTLKVRIIDIDEVGMVCCVKGMMGGWGDPHVRPWPSIVSVFF